MATSPLIGNYDALSQCSTRAMEDQDLNLWFINDIVPVEAKKPYCYSAMPWRDTEKLELLLVESEIPTTPRKILQQETEKEKKTKTETLPQKTHGYNTRPNPKKKRRL